MDKLLKNILRIKDGKGITDQKFQTDLGLYASAVSEWKKGKSKSYEKHLPRIAEYLEVSVDYLLGRSMTLNEQLNGIDFALAGELRDLTNDEKQDILDYIRFKKAQKEVKKQ